RRRSRRQSKAVGTTMIRNGIHSGSEISEMAGPYKSSRIQHPDTDHASAITRQELVACQLDQVSHWPQHDHQPYRTIQSRVGSPAEAATRGHHQNEPQASVIAVAPSESGRPSPFRPSMTNYRPDWRWAMASELATQARVPREIFTKDRFLGRI